MNDEQKELFRLLQQSINKAYNENRPLFKVDDGIYRTGLEQSFVFRIGIYLQELLRKSEFKNLDLDLEYNKNMNRPKSTSSKKDGTRPDLILHERFSNDNNRLIVEFKGSWQNEEDDDIKKLKDFTANNQKYKYSFGVFVKLNMTDAVYKCFSNGTEL
jgi:hypothetical protein